MKFFITCAKGLVELRQHIKLLRLNFEMLSHFFSIEQLLHLALL